MSIRTSKKTLVVVAVSAAVYGANLLPAIADGPSSGNASPAQSVPPSDAAQTAFLTPMDGLIEPDEEKNGKEEVDKKESSQGAASEDSASKQAASKEPESKESAGKEATFKSETVESLDVKKAAVSATAVLDSPLVIDNDDAKIEKVTEYQWKEIVDSDGKTHIDAGARFPVCVVTSHSSKTAKVGDPVEGVLKIDLKIGGRLVAAKGSRVVGHVASTKPARKLLHAELSKSRWMRPSGAMSIQFDEIVTKDGEHLPLMAMPARQARIVNNSAEGRVLGVNMNGEISAPLSSQLKAQAIHLAIRAGASAGGVFSFGAVPAAYGVLGAVNPSFAFMHPVGKNVRHRRLKGFAMGAVSGLPGGFLISDSVISGPEAIIKPGDEFLAEFKQKFTGEPASEAELMPNVKTKVHGEVLPEPQKK